VHVQVNAVQRNRLTNSINKNKTPSNMHSHNNQVGQNLPVHVSGSEPNVYGCNFSPGSKTVTVVEAIASVSFDPISLEGHEENK
jgi:hypothetical protein